MNSNMIKFDLPKNQSSIIKVLGVGGGGSNAVNHMFSQGIEGVDFIVCNTDSQALEISPVPNKVQLGVSLTEGKGAGSKPDVGKNAAIEDLDSIREMLSKNTKMIFITAGMGGGTGTGAAPVIAQAAKEMGVLTVGIVTIPFSFEGRKRRLQAEEGLKQLKANVDALIVICNDKLRELYGNLTMTEAFSRADNVLTTAAKGIAEIITLTGGINVDFADVKTVMTDSGVALMGSGTAEGENRAIKAVEAALTSPLLNDNIIRGAKNVLLNITSGKEELLMDEISEITDYIQDECGSTADVIWGYGRDERLGNKISVIVVATGFGENSDVYATFDSRPAEKIVRPLAVPEANTPISAVNVVPNEELGLEFKIKQVSATEPAPPAIERKPEHGQVSLNLNTDIPKSDSFEPVRIKTPSPSAVKDREVERLPLDVPQPSEDELRKQRFERERRLRELSVKLKTSEGLVELEKQPAYQRRNVVLNRVPSSSESQVSRYTLNDTDGKGLQIKSNNSFLHDNVD